MRRLIYNCTIILVITIMLNLLLRCTLSDYWAVNVLEEKVKCYNEISNELETIVLGSSRIFFQFDPILFDSICGNPQNTTYNLGATGASPSENLALLKTLLKEDHSFKNVVVEYGLYYGANHQWANSAKSTYFWDYDLLKTALNVYKDNTKEYLAHVRLGWNSLAFLGHGRNVLQSYLLSNKTRIADNIPIKPIVNILKTPIQNDINRCNTHGYKPLEGIDHLWDEAARSKWVESRVKTILPKGELHETSEKFLIDFQQVCEENNINLYYLFSPHDPWYDHSQLKNKISLGDMESFPEYFRDDVWHDRFHLNSVGARLYTSRFAHIWQGLKE